MKNCYKFHGFPVDNTEPTVTRILTPSCPSGNSNFLMKNGKKIPGFSVDNADSESNYILTSRCAFSAASRSTAIRTLSTASGVFTAAFFSFAFASVF